MRQHILVEGQNDLHVILNLWTVLGLNSVKDYNKNKFAVVANGKENIPLKIAELLASSDVENIGIVALPNPNQPAVPVNENFAQIGKPVPEFKLIDQNGKPFTFKDYRGKAVAVTFIYRECPLPEFCIKMSRNFSDLANQLHDDAEAKEKIRLLSISFDPERDTPEKLKQYGLGYLGKGSKADFTIWHLAVGADKEVRAVADFFGLRYEVDQADKTQFNHSLRTAVIGPDGTVKKIFAGNEWTTEELLTELKAAVN